MDTTNQSKRKIHPCIKRRERNNREAKRKKEKKKKKPENPPPFQEIANPRIAPLHVVFALPAILCCLTSNKKPNGPNDASWRRQLEFLPCPVG